MALVQEALACHRTAKARDTVVAVHFTLELVVVREFLLLFDISQRIDNDPLRPIHPNNLRCTVWHARMVDEACNAALLRSVNDCILVDAEQVAAADALFLVYLLAEICNALANLLAYVLNNHVLSANILVRIQTPTMDC